MLRARRITAEHKDMRASACLLAVAIFATIAHADSPNTIAPFAPLLVEVNKAFASANGTWDQNSSATARNAVTIECYPVSKECVEAIADADATAGLFTVRLDYWQVTSWTDTEVVAVKIESCVTTTLTINASHKMVTTVMRNGGAVRGRCGVPLDKPIIQKLLDATPFNLARSK
jgi:hypothetical protein